MTWQRGFTTLYSSLVLLVLLQSCLCVPHQAYYPQTHLVPAQQFYAQQQIIPDTSRVILLPQGIAGLASHQQYAAAVPGRAPVNGQYVLLLRQEKGDGDTENPETTEKPDSGSSWWTSFLPTLPPLPSFIGGSETTTAKPADQAQGSQPAKLEELEPASPGKPAQPVNPLLPGSVVATPDQRYILGQPQYYGTYEGLKQLGIKNLGNKGAIPNFLLVRGVQPGVHHLGGKPEPEKFRDVSGAGTAALAFQRYLEEQRDVSSGASHAAAEIQKYLEQQRLADSSRDLGAVVVNAERKGSTKKEEGGEEDAEDVEATHPNGPSVAQVKPQAIALAGPGGVAASAPVGTALVGPGGLAVAAPAATAVAGPSGGAPPVVAPAQRILEAYLKRQENRGYVALTR